MKTKQALFSSVALLGLALSHQNAWADNDTDYRALGSSAPQTSQQSDTEKNSLFSNKSQQYYEYDAPQKVGLWLSTGLGYGGLNNGSGVAGTTNLNFRFANNYYAIFSAAVLGDSSISMPGLFTQLGYQKQHARNIGFLYGNIENVRSGFYTYGIGLAMSRGREKDYGQSSSSIGIPIQAQYVWTPFSYLGIGVKGFAAFNGSMKQNNYGATLEISLGKFA